MKIKFYILSYLVIGLLACEKETLIDNKPQLEILVIDEAGNHVSGASVNLYAYEADWKNRSNSIASSITLNTGKALFEGLEEKAYYFFIQKGELSNQKSLSYLKSALQTNVRAELKIIIK